MCDLQTATELVESVRVAELDQWHAGKCVRLARMLREARQLADALGFGGSMDATGNTIADTLEQIAERALIEA